MRCLYGCAAGIPGLWAAPSAITTRQRPALSVSRLDLLARNNAVRSLLDDSTLDKTKGLIRFFNRPLRFGDTARAAQNALYLYGADTFDSQLFYAIDYVAGFSASSLSLDKVSERLSGTQSATSATYGARQGVYRGA